MEYELAAGDHLVVEWPPVPDGEIAGDVEYAPGMVTIAERGSGHSRAWNSDGQGAGHATAEHRVAAGRRPRRLVRRRRHRLR
ncbi:hypothetical protein, partial [Streptomyces roseolus]|uniref:hypothetical protein n=1 Tax=Streptomyces roseolus TaxID=67358 RepID=UPI003646DE66